MFSRKKSMASRFGEVLDEIRKPADRVRAAAEKAGYHFDSIETLTGRIQGLSKLVYYVFDDKIDIEDRVKHMSATLILIGMVWGRARNDEIWAELYTAWGVMCFYWVTILSRGKKATVDMVEIEELKEVTIKDENGKSITKPDWVPDSVKPMTAVEMFLTQPEGQETMRILSFEEAKVKKSVDPDEAYRMEEHDAFVKWFGEAIMILTGFQILNYAWNEMDVLAKETLVLQQMGQQPGGATTVHVTTGNEGEAAS